MQDRLKFKTVEINGQPTIQFILTDNETKELEKVLRLEYSGVAEDSRERKQVQKLKEKSLST